MLEQHIRSQACTHKNFEEISALSKKKYNENKNGKDNYTGNIIEIHVCMATGVHHATITSSSL
jgi:hypothetical protein